MPFQFSAGPQSSIRVLVAVVIAFGTLLLSAAPADAQWRFDPSIGAGLTHNDNPELSSEDASVESVSGWAVEGNADITYDTQLAKFSITPKLRAKRYDGFSELDSNDVFVDFDYLYTGQLSTFRVRGSYDIESVRTAERSNIDFETEDPEDIPTDASGRVRGTENRDRAQISPDWSYRFGQKSSILLGATYLDVTYDKSATTALRDYTQTSGRASYRYNLSTRNTIALSGYYRQNDFAENPVQPRGFGMTVDYERSLSETTRFRSSIGVDSSEDSNEADQKNPIGRISITRRLQTYRLLAAYRRSIGGSGSSELSVTDTVNLNLTRDLSEKFVIGAGLRAYQKRALDSGVVDFDEQDYVQIGGLFTWNLSRQFSVDFDFRHTILDRKLLPSDASSNEADLWFRYHPAR